MRVVITILCLLLLLSGCATYTLQKGQPPYDKGFVYSRDGKVLPEYTLGDGKSLPEEESLARQRFKRRRSIVEHYYKKMDVIENRFKQSVVDPPVMMLGFITGVFRLPFIAVSDRKYERDPAYRQKVQERQLLREAAEEARLKSWQAKLEAYVQEDLKKEEQIKAQAMEKPPVRLRKAKSKPAPPAAAASAQQQAEAVSRELATIESQEEALAGGAVVGQPSAEAVAKKPFAGRLPQAVIVARPKSGPSPLVVHFSAARSRAFGNAKIVSYEWDFGDGDTSAKKSPVNTYLNMGYETVPFTVSLTVKDSQGNTAVASTVIEVTPR